LTSSTDNRSMVNWFQALTLSTDFKHWQSVNPHAMIQLTALDRINLCIESTTTTNHTSQGASASNIPFTVEAIKLTYLCTGPNKIVTSYLLRPRNCPAGTKYIHVGWRFWGVSVAYANTSHAQARKAPCGKSLVLDQSAAPAAELDSLLDGQRWAFD